MNEDPMKRSHRPRLRLAVAALLVFAGACSTLRGGVVSWAGWQQGLATPPWDELWILTREGVAAATAPLEPSTLVGRTEDGERVSLLLQRFEVRADVFGRVASVTVREIFTNPAEESVDACYVLPLPLRATVTDFVLRIGNRSIRGVVRERPEAERMYAAARDQGLLATLLSADDSLGLEQRIASIAPRSTIELQARYVHAVPYSDGWCDLLLPRAQGPEPFDALYVVEIDAGLPIESLETFGLDTEPDRPSEREARWRGSVRVTNAAPDVRVRYRVGGDEWSAVLWGNKMPGEGARFLLMTFPSAGRVTSAWFRVDWGGIRVEEVAPPLDSPIGASKPLAIVGRMHGAGGDAVPSAWLSSGREVALPIQWVTGTSGRALRTMWARAKLASVLARAEETEAVRSIADEARAVALHHGLVSFVTSLVLVDASSR